MQLWTDLIKPVELTAFSRELVAANDVSGNPSTLANVFPSIPPVYGSTYTFSLNHRVSEAASYRSFDTEAPIGRGAAQEQVTVSLPPLSLKKRLTEYDQIRRMGANSPETVQGAAERLAAEVVDAIINRLILARAEALTTGQLVIDENGFKQTIDFGRRGDFTTTAGTKWDAATPGDPIMDLVTWRNAMANDEYSIGAPDVLITSSTVMAVLMRSSAVRAYFGSQATGMIGIEDIATLFRSYGLPTPTVLDARIDGQRVIPEKSIILARSGAGTTSWGQTTESQDTRYGIAYADQPGLVVGAYRQDDPDVAWIRSNALAMPILNLANSTLAATVLKA